MIVTTPPQVKPAEPLSASVSVGLTTTEKSQIAAKAKRAGLSVSAYCRRKILA